MKQDECRLEIYTHTLQMLNWDLKMMVVSFNQGNI